jgi:hypothetical protein
MKPRRFVLLVDNEAFMQLNINPSNYSEMYIAGLQSNPTIIDITDLGVPEGPVTGWMWDGETLKAPQ